MNVWTRRALIGTGTLTAGLAGAVLYARHRFPGWFHQYVQEMGLPIQPAPHLPDPRQWPDKGFHAAWLGHSTVLLKLDGFTILTDPIFSNRAGLDFYIFTAGVKRMVAPAISTKQLPPVDLILNSHVHMDHLDTPTMRRLESKGTEVIMASQTSDLIRRGRYKKVTEMGWGDVANVGPARVKAFEVRHWGARMQTDTYRGYNGYVVEVNKRRVLFAGDTALTDTFRTLKQQNDIDLAIMPIGAYNPWIRVHCNPEQAWRMGNEAGAAHFMPVHHSTFTLSREPLKEPIERFVSAAGSRPERIVTTSIGQEFHWS